MLRNKLKRTFIGKLMLKIVYRVLNKHYLKEWNREHKFLVDIYKTNCDLPYECDTEDIISAVKTNPDAELILFFCEDDFNQYLAYNKSYIERGKIIFSKRNGLENILREIYSDDKALDSVNDILGNYYFLDGFIGLVLTKEEWPINGLEFKLNPYLCTNCDDRKRITNLISENNVRNYMLICRETISRVVVDKIAQFKKYCSENEIDINEVCIVGSGVLGVFDIRDPHDIDFLCTSENRKIYADRNKISSFDLVKSNYLSNQQKVYITDDDLINNSNNYFLFMGCKFLNIEYIFLKKIVSGGKKSFYDRKKMEIYFYYMLNMSETGGALNRQLLQDILEEFR